MIYIYINKQKKHLKKAIAFLSIHIMCHYKGIIDVLENNHKKLNDAAKEMQRISRVGQNYLALIKRIRAHSMQ